MRCEDAQRAALMALVNLACAPEVHDALLERGALRTLLRAAGLGGDGGPEPAPDIRQYATYVCARYACAFPVWAAHSTYAFPMQVRSGQPPGQRGARAGAGAWRRQRNRGAADVGDRLGRVGDAHDRDRGGA